jgi:hypothetical protein
MVSPQQETSMNPNPEQVKSAVRWLITTFGGGVAGWFAAKGWFTIDQVTSVINSPTTVAVVAALVSGAWGLITHTQKNAVTVVDTIAKQPDSPVKAVVMEPTIAGRELADSLPGNTTVVAGTTAAVTLARAA